MFDLIDKLRKEIKASTNRSDKLVELSNKLYKISELNYLCNSSRNYYNTDYYKYELLNCVALFNGKIDVPIKFEDKEVEHYTIIGLCLNFLFKVVRDTIKSSKEDYSKILLNEKIYDKLVNKCTITFDYGEQKAYEYSNDSFSVVKRNIDEVINNQICNCSSCQYNLRKIKEYKSRNELIKLIDLWSRY